MSSLNSDTRDQRRNNGTEDSTAMTIEYLRARLLSERSVSRAARLRSEELTKRVVQLEEHLKIATSQRKRAENATAEVLAILENHGMSDVSEEIDLSSDEEEICESNDGSDITNGQEFTTSRRDGGLNSGSEVESSPSIGRSLSWNNGPRSQNSSQLKHMDSARRRYASFVPKKSSTNRMGKSCRRNRRQEIRSTIEVSPNSSSFFHDDVSTACSLDSSGCSNVQLQELGAKLKESQRANGHLRGEVGRYQDVEGAVQHQEQLIGRYEAEENAQREWEEKFRENNTCSHVCQQEDSLNPANNSDLTEERDDIKSTGKLCLAAGIIDRDMDREDTSSNEVSMHEVLSFPLHEHPSLQEKDDEIVHESSKSDAGTSSSMNGNTDQLQSVNHIQTFVSKDRSVHSIADDSSSGNKSRGALLPNETTNDVGSTLGACADESSSRSRSQGALSNEPKNDVESILGACADYSSSQRSQGAVSTGSKNVVESSIGACTDGSSSQSRYQGALVLDGPTNSVGPILEALQQAKFSLTQKLQDQAMFREGRISGRVINPFDSVTRDRNRGEIPGIGCPALFRLPTDLQCEAISRPNSSGITAPGLNMTDYYPRIYSKEYFSSPSMEPKPSALASRQLHPSSVSSAESISRPYLANFAIKSSSDAGSSSSTKFSDLDLPFTTYPFMASRDADLPSSSRFTNVDLRGNNYLPYPRRGTFPVNHFSPDIIPRLPFDVTNLSSLHKNNVRLHSAFHLSSDNDSKGHPAVHLSLYGQSKKNPHI